MGEWFNERYISRDEHQRIVEYYRTLVAQLYGNVRDLRLLMAVEQAAPPPGFEQVDVPEELLAEPTLEPDPEPDLGSNVVSLGSYRERRAARMGLPHA
jgi:hypothetical protein